MTVNLSEKDYMQLLDATGGHPDQVFQPGTEIFIERSLMPHAADCTVHTGKRCDCHPEIKRIFESMT